MPLVQKLLESLARASAEFDLGRSDSRYTVHAPVTLGVVLGQGEFKPLYRAWATDLSLCGVGLLAENGIPVGLSLHVNFETMVGRPCVLAIRTIYCKQILPHTYRIGAALLLDSRADEPDELSLSLPEPAPEAHVG